MESTRIEQRLLNPIEGSPFLSNSVPPSHVRTHVIILTIFSYIVTISDDPLDSWLIFSFKWVHHFYLNMLLL